MEQPTIIKILKNIFSKKPPELDEECIIPREEHTVSRQHVSPGALKVLYRLKKAGYESYIVGGGVRDLLLGLEPKDFDIATNAKPNQIKKLFSNSRLIGRRFRLAHIQYGKEIVEVATFRGSSNKGDTHLNEEGMIKRDNTFGTLEEDAWRRDITINAMYYNIADFSIVDLTGGMQDIEDRLINMIGDPTTRYQEDPVRMLRVIRLAAKLDFDIEKNTQEAIPELGHLLLDVSNARIFDEVLKILHCGSALRSFTLLRQLQLFEHLFPSCSKSIETNKEALRFIQGALSNTDKRIHSGKTTTPAFISAAFLWFPLQEKAQEIYENGSPYFQAFQSAMSHVLSQQSQFTAIPRRFTTTIRDIWHLQHRLTGKINKRAFITLHHPRFRAAYDFLLARAKANPELQERADWWTDFQESDEATQRKMISHAPSHQDKNPSK